MVLSRAKVRLHQILQKDQQFTDEDIKELNPAGAISIQNALNFVKNPVTACKYVYSLAQELTASIGIKKNDPKSAGKLLLKS